MSERQGVEGCGVGGGAEWWARGLEWNLIKAHF